ncbi:hypothetical protein ACFL0Y_00365 [Patescibacteria group bacterium]
MGSPEKILHPEAEALRLVGENLILHAEDSSRRVSFLQEEAGEDNAQTAPHRRLSIVYVNIGAEALALSNRLEKEIKQAITPQEPMEFGE